MGASIEVQLCFLCEKMEPTSELRQAMTMQLNQRLNECARNLNDGKLLALLSGGDVVALELKYHSSCLAALYNRERGHTLRQRTKKNFASRLKKSSNLDGFSLMGKRLIA